MSASTRYNKHEFAEPQYQRPHNVNSTISSARVILAVKNFASIPGVCHIGLGVTASNTLKVLRRHGVRIDAWALATRREIRTLNSKNSIAGWKKKKGGLAEEPRRSLTL